MNSKTVLENTSLVCANYGNGSALEEILLDWFSFLGGKPGEVILADAGSDEDTHKKMQLLLSQGCIDIGLFYKVGHPQKEREFAYMKEFIVPHISSKKYILFFKIDSLPFRLGFDSWISEAATFLEEEDIFAIGGSFNYKAKHQDSRWSGYFFSRRCSENFAFMKKDECMKAFREYAGEFIDSGFIHNNPLPLPERKGRSRFLVEICWEKYMEKHNKFTLVKKESSDWRIFHTNSTEEGLLKVRKEFFNGKNIESFLNAGMYTNQDEKMYYGKKKTFVQKIKKIIKKFIGSNFIGKLKKNYEKHQ